VEKLIWMRRDLENKRRFFWSHKIFIIDFLLGFEGFKMSAQRKKCGNRSKINKINKIQYF